jgi:ABC-type sugar transport system ATPase subunit
MSTDGVIIKINDITKNFGGTTALDGVSFEINKGEIHAIVGENGAGKSTMMKILAGVHKPDEGKVFVKDKEITVFNPNVAAEIGISIVFQELNLYPQLTVADNIFMNYELNSGGLLKKGKMAKESSKILKRLQQDHIIEPMTAVMNLPVADQQIVEISRAFLHGSEILILDEPNSALSESETLNLFKLIKKLKEDGITIIYVSHRLEEVFQISDRISVLRDGRYINTWVTKETDIKEIIAAMIGRKLKEVFPERNIINDDAKVILEVKGLSKKGSLESINLKVREGEVLGLAGLEGCGIEDIFQIIFGLTKRDAGDIFYEGEPVKGINPWTAIQKNLGLIPAERHKQGLMLNWTVRDNITLAIVNRLLNLFRLINLQKQAKVARDYVEKLNIVTNSIFNSANSLSGGNQQKLVLAKWLATQPKLMLLNDPTRGVDVGAKAEIYKLIIDLASEGFAIIFTSSEVEEILEICHKIHVIYKGKLVKTFKGGEVRKPELMTYVAGAFKN